MALASPTSGSLLDILFLRCNPLCHVRRDAFRPLLDAHKTRKVAKSILLGALVMESKVGRKDQVKRFTVHIGIQTKPCIVEIDKPQTGTNRIVRGFGNTASQTPSFPQFPQSTV